MRAISSCRLAALTMLAIGSGQFLAPTAQARLWLDNGVSLNGMRLNGANLNGTNLNGANLNGANLNGANLDGTQATADVGRLRLRAILPGEGR